MALKPEEIAEVLRENGVESEKITAVMTELNQLEEAKKEERGSSGPKPKSQFAVLLMDDGTLAQKDIQAYVVQIPDDKQGAYAVTSLYDAAREYNNTARKAKKYPVKTIGEAMETLKGRILKDRKLKIKTKVSVTAVPVVNDIPDPTKRPAND